MNNVLASIYLVSDFYNFPALPYNCVLGGGCDADTCDSQTKSCDCPGRTYDCSQDASMFS